MTDEIKDIIVLDNPENFMIDCFPYKARMVIAFFCEKGSAWGRVNMKEYEIGPGGFVLILYDQIIESTSVSDDFEGKILLIGRDFSESIGVRESFRVSSNLDDRQFFILPEREAEVVNCYLKMCSFMIESADESSRSEALRLLSKSFFMAFAMSAEAKEPSADPDDRAAAITEDFLALVSKHYKETRDLGYYSDRMCLTPKYLSQSVKKASGRTAMDWMERYVLLDAKSQLASTERNVTEISDDLGFSSPAFFSKYFRRLTGLSPSRYKKENYRKTGV